MVHSKYIHIGGNATFAGFAIKYIIDANKLIKDITVLLDNNDEEDEDAIDSKTLESSLLALKKGRMFAASMAIIQGIDTALIAAFVK